MATYIPLSRSTIFGLDRDPEDKKVENKNKNKNKNKDKRQKQHRISKSHPPSEKVTGFFSSS
jgi:hypothetical protein